MSPTGSIGDRQRARDYAALLLLSRPGCAAHEVVGLELENFAWRAGIVRPWMKGRERNVPAALGAMLRMRRCLPGGTPGRVT